MVWEPKTCCWCVSVKTGTLVLGWMGVIGAALNLLSMLKFTALTRVDIVKICQNVTEVTDGELCADGVIGVIITLTIGSILMAIMCGMLLWGVTKYKPTFMLPYLISHGLGLICTAISAVVIFILLAYHHVVLGAFIALIMLGFVLFIDVYLFLVVRVCYKEVKQHSLAMMTGANIAYVEQREDMPYKM